MDEENKKQTVCSIPKRVYFESNVSWPIKGKYVGEIRFGRMQFVYDKSWVLLQL